MYRNCLQLSYKIIKISDLNKISLIFTQQQGLDAEIHLKGIWIGKLFLQGLENLIWKTHTQPITGPAGLIQRPRTTSVLSSFML